MIKLLGLPITIALATQSVLAEETVLYCTEKHIVGLQITDEKWGPAYGAEDQGRRYAIRFNEDFSQMSGFQETGTNYVCSKWFPTKAPDVVSCMNPRVATMVFNYSIKTNRFLVTLVGPGGWLREGTQREMDVPPLDDHIIAGSCQEF